MVLCYHAVTEGWHDGLSVDRMTLERQVRLFLRRGLKPVRAADVLSGRGRLLHVTFDDAFESVRRALPALERLGVPVTVFACTDYAVEGRPLDVPELAERGRGFGHELATMNWDSLRELSERGVEIGSHTRTHPHLPRLSDEEVDRELRESRVAVEDRLGRPCPFLAYPFGDEDRRVRDAARRAGYDAAFALPGDSSGVDRYALPRVGIYRKDGVARTFLKTSPALRRAAARVRRVRRGPG